MLKELQKLNKNVFIFFSPTVLNWAVGSGVAVFFSDAGGGGATDTAWDWKTFTLN